MKDITIVSADWSKSPEKRAVYVAERTRGWKIGREKPPDGGWTLVGLLAHAHSLSQGSASPVLIGVDAVLGVPAAFGRTAGFPDFPSALRGLALAGALENEANDPGAWCWERPFFRVPAGSGGLSQFYKVAGGRDMLLREVEKRTQAKSVFVLSGIPGTVGSGSRSLWRELVDLMDVQGQTPCIWPFEGPLEQLLSEQRVVLAETYPRVAYSLALEPSLPAPILPLKKAKLEVRRQAIVDLKAAPWVFECGVNLDGLSAAESNDDDFDALLVAVGLTRLLAERRALRDDLIDPRWEGGILGAGMAVLSPPR